MVSLFKAQVPWFLLFLGLLLIADLSEGWAGVVEAVLAGVSLSYGLTGVVRQEVEESLHEGNG